MTNTKNKVTKIDIPYTSFTENIKNYRSELVSAFESCLDSGRYVNGPNNLKFEKNFSKLCSTQFATGIASGTCALHLSLKAIKLKKNDEVIIPPNSFIATSNAIELNRGRVIFADINQDLNINPNEIEKVITNRTKAIIPVHLSGRPASMEKIKKIAKEHKIFLLEDAAQSIGAKLNNVSVGSFGDLACFSFHPLKNLHTFGDSGMVVSNSKKLISEISLLKNHGLKTREDCIKPGFNCRMDEIHASILNVQLKYFKKNTILRRKKAMLYNKLLSPYVEVPFENDGEYHVYQTYIIQAENRDKLYNYLRSHGVECLIHYPYPTHKQSIYKNNNYKNLKYSEIYSKRILSLPLYPSLSENNIEKISTLIKKFYI